MCLDSIIHDIKPVKEGYKAYSFIDTDGMLMPVFKGPSIKIGKWYTSYSILGLLLGDVRSDKLCTNLSGEKYRPGFHIFNKLSDVTQITFSYSVIVKVVVKSPICVGMQYGVPVTVARKMKVLEIISDNPK